MCDDYNRIKSYLYSHNWHLLTDEFYGLIENCPTKVGYKINLNMESDSHYFIHFWFNQSDLYGDVWLHK
jgi:hypothetical protein